MKETKLNFNTKPPVDLPGYFLMDVSFIEKKDLKRHDDSLDEEYKYIYEDPLNFINILQELNECVTEERKEEIYKNAEVIDKDYYAKQNERSEVFLRHAQQSRLKRIFNFAEFLKESFDLVRETDDDVVESYELIKSNEDDFIMIVGESEPFTEYKNERSTTVVNKITVKGRPYNLTKQKADKYICINIKEGKAYFSEMKSIYKISK